jgi:hypothetical protein
MDPPRLWDLLVFHIHFLSNVEIPSETFKEETRWPRQSSWIKSEEETTNRPSGLNHQLPLKIERKRKLAAAVSGLLSSSF